MTNTEILKSAIVHHVDGSFYVTPDADLSIALLDGMIDAQRFARESIAWTEITASYVKGQAVVSGARFVVSDSNLPMSDEDALIEWMFYTDEA